MLTCAILNGNVTLKIANSIFYPAPMLPDLDGSAYPPHKLIFQPGYGKVNLC